MKPEASLLITLHAEQKICRVPAPKFAHFLDVSPEHLSRVEDGHEGKFGGSADRLVRAFAVMARKAEHRRLRNVACRRRQTRKA